MSRPRRAGNITAKRFVVLRDRVGVGTDHNLQQMSAQVMVPVQDTKGGFGAAVFQWNGSETDVRGFAVFRCHDWQWPDHARSQMKTLRQTMR